MGAVQSAETGSGKGRYISGDVCAGSHYSRTTLHTSAYEDGTDRRFRNVGIYKTDAVELP